MGRMARGKQQYGMEREERRNKWKGKKGNSSKKFRN